MIFPEIFLSFLIRSFDSQIIIFSPDGIEEIKCTAESSWRKTLRILFCFVYIYDILSTTQYQGL